jgi:hypothetical protein
MEAAAPKPSARPVWGLVTAMQGREGVRTRGGVDQRRNSDNRTTALRHKAPKLPTRVSSAPDEGRPDHAGDEDFGAGPDHATKDGDKGATAAANLPLLTALAM